ncbi:MAG: hypothetical protein ABIG20_03055 [archaeon]
MEIKKFSKKGIEKRFAKLSEDYIKFLKEAGEFTNKFNAKESIRDSSVIFAAYWFGDIIGWVTLIEKDSPLYERYYAEVKAEKFLPKKDIAFGADLLVHPKHREGKLEIELYQKHVKDAIKRNLVFVDIVNFDKVEMYTKAVNEKDMTLDYTGLVSNRSILKEEEVLICIKKKIKRKRKKRK